MAAHRVSDLSTCSPAAAVHGGLSHPAARAHGVCQRAQQASRCKQRAFLPLPGLEKHDTWSFSSADYCKVATAQVSSIMYESVGWSWHVQLPTSGHNDRERRLNVAETM